MELKSAVDNERSRQGEGGWFINIAFLGRAILKYVIADKGTGRLGIQWDNERYFRCIVF